MMQLSNIELAANYVGYGEGAVPGYKCEVQLRLPEQYQTFKVKLTDEQTKEVVALAVKLALGSLTMDLDTIDVVGTPGKPRPRDETKADVAADDVMPL